MSSARWSVLTLELKSVTSWDSQILRRWNIVISILLNTEFLWLQKLTMDGDIDFDQVLTWYIKHEMKSDFDIAGGLWGDDFAHHSTSFTIALWKSDWIITLIAYFWKENCLRDCEIWSRLSSLFFSIVTNYCSCFVASGCLLPCIISLFQVLAIQDPSLPQKQSLGTDPGPAPGKMNFRRNHSPHLMAALWKQMLRMCRWGIYDEHLDHVLLCSDAQCLLMPTERLRGVIWRSR